MDQAHKAMLGQTVQIAPYLGQDGYGKPSYGPAVTYPARIEEHYQTVPSATGVILHDLTVVFVAEDAVVNIQSRVMIQGAVRSLQGIKPVLDEPGQIDHYQLYL